jgi:hypothetical protein
MSCDSEFGWRWNAVTGLYELWSVDFFCKVSPIRLTLDFGWAWDGLLTKYHPLSSFFLSTVANTHYAKKIERSTLRLMCALRCDETSDRARVEICTVRRKPNVFAVYLRVQWVATPSSVDVGMRWPVTGFYELWSVDFFFLLQSQSTWLLRICTMQRKWNGSHSDLCMRWSVMGDLLQRSSRYLYCAKKI